MLSFSINTLPEQFQLEWHQLLLAALGVMVIGFSKSGIKGIAIISVTILALVFGSKASSGIMLTFLIVGDCIAVVYYKRHVQWKLLFKFLPWMLAGVFLGVFIGKDLNEVMFKRVLSYIILLSVVLMFYFERRKDKAVPDQWWFAAIMGLGAGFTTMIGNMAGAFSNLFFLALRVPKNEFIGTAAWLFFIINLVKLPFHIFYWKTISLDTINLTGHLLIFLLIGFAMGFKLLKYINNTTFRRFILVVTFLGALLILFK
ncbi:MAG: sulfite exporter TauE/SafE family protein [Bacteroidota bacterium]